MISIFTKAAIPDIMLENVQPNELYFIIVMSMKSLRIIFLLLVLRLGHAEYTSLCTSCVNTFNSYCIQCSSAAGSCMTGSVYNTATKLCACSPMFYQAMTSLGNPYCDRCFLGCLTCSGPLATNCLTCVSNFTFSSNNSTCSPPSTSNDYSVQLAYYFLNFNLLSNWYWQYTSGTYLLSSSNTYTCNSYTLAGLSRRASNLISNYYSLQTHFEVRVMFSHYFFLSASTTQSIYISAQTASAYVPISGTSSGANNPNISCLSGNTAVMTMVDQSLSHSGSSLTLYISTTNNQGQNFYWGLREVFIQIRLCDASCSSCNGYTSNNCTACNEANRISTYTGYVGTCLCYGSSSYVQLMYQETSANTCVYMCPNIPVETFGDNVTRNCLPNCPNNSYAYTDLYRCWADCPKTSIVTNQLLFKDKLNWRCVPNCPSATPYANAEDNNDRFCYTNCPNRTNKAGQTVDYYAVDGLSPLCVSVCPYNATFKLFGYQGKCIALCPDGTWGDPATKLCISNCTNSPFLYKDNSTGQNICSSNCSYPNFFRDNTTGTCVAACVSPYFGETTRECITQCASGEFGLPFGTRECASFCPDGWWGQPDKAVCVNTSAQCKTTGNNRYADNYTRKCVFPLSCSMGFWAQNITQMCQSTCVKATSPLSIINKSVGDPSTRLCQSACLNGLFADFVAGLCVSACITNNTYADVYSSYQCVVACNTTGATPWADNKTWTCVSSCNTTGVANSVRDSTTWKCVFQCPDNYYADFITTNNPICRSVCLTGTYADNSTGTGLCVYICSVYPATFGDATNGLNLCVSICSVNLYGDQTGNRTCVPQCPSSYFAQNDTTRRCVPKCKPGTYGQNRWCNTNPFNCTVNTFANDANNLCDGCSAVQSTWGDNTTKRCVTQCPLNSGTGPVTYYADISIRQCTLTCSASYTTGATTVYSTGLWGNNNTRTCEFICIDLNAYVQNQSNNPNRVCVAKCYPAPVFRYANNYTKVCVTSINCPTNTFGQNSTQVCVNSCPSGSFGYATVNDKVCIDVCPLTHYGQNSTGVNLCVTLCSAIPPLFADPTTKLCVAVCPSPYYADPTTRKCVLNCPYSPTPYYAYEPNRTCITVCPNNYFANFTLQNISGLPSNTNISRCVLNSSSCGVNQWGDSYLRKCVALCTGPSPVNLFGYWPECVSTCPGNYYSTTYNGVRLCVLSCPPSVSGTAAPNLYGDPTTKTCVSRCVTPLTWADYQTRLCQSPCSATPLATYSQNFYFTCVTSLYCPTSPSMTFGDNNTRSCLSNCTLGTFGDPTSRNCVTQCPNVSTTGSSTYYSDTSTGIYLCVVICPINPVLFGLNSTNKCVQTCPSPYYGDQTGNRTCLAVCPLIGATVWFAQNTSRICVTVCITGTWGYVASRLCVQTATNCLAQWADNTTNLCVTQCPASANTFADPTTKFCVAFCPPNYYADITTRTCVQTCPSAVQEHGTFGNNLTRTCQEVCSLINGTITYADTQTVNRFCVLKCSQTPNRAFADYSTASCVPICPTFPSLYGQTTNFTCVSTCSSTTYADTNARLCVTDCPTSTFKQTSPNICVSVCPFDEINPLYGDSNTGFCVSTCTNNFFRYNTLSICVASCTTYSLFAYNMTCVKLCPIGFYANSSGICVATCPSNSYGQNTTTACRTTCLTGFASGSLCVAVCPNGSYGENFVCVSSCQISGNIASSTNNLCIGTCTSTTYAQNGLCSSTCTSGTFADPSTNLCSSSCTNSRYGDSTTNTCVTQCPSGYYKDSTGYCLNVCVSPKFADNVTWSCVAKCSTGYWGYNLLCVTICPNGTYGYLSDRICYSVPNRPVSSPVYFADNVTQTWVTTCPINPLAFGDITLKYCIADCLSGTFADPATRRCNSSGCQNSSYFADSTTNQCVLVCPAGYFSNTNNGRCESICSSGYAYNITRACVAICPTPYSGYDNITALICVNKCPLNYYSYNRVCSPSCPPSYYAENSSNQCIGSCVNSFASDDARRCVSSCSSYANYKFADNSSNSCVDLCPTTPDYFEDNFVCVFTCSGGKFADPTAGVRKCTSLCTIGLFSDPLSGRCMAYCPVGYWAQNVTNNCLTQCVSGSYADNITGKCVIYCPTPTYADTTTQRCVKTCPTGYFGEVNNVCVLKCTLPNYANPLTRRCEANCPTSAQLYAENTTASCVASCSIVANSYADPAINVCVSNCTLGNFYMLDSLGICTNLCPLGLFMQNSTKKCQATCTTGFAQPTTRYCVAKCFGNPQTYGYSGVCHYKCLNATYNLYADNSTSLCVPTCPGTVSFFSDPLSGNCVLFCPDGYFAENDTRTCTTYCLVGFADNLTRKCVAVCPTASQVTFGDPSTHRCVRVCPSNTFAQNSSKECVAYNACPGISWSDTVSKYCVARCPAQPSTFGLNSTTSCVSRCPLGLFGDNATQTCLSSCPSLNGEYRFADPVSQTCVFVCPIQSGLFGDANITGNFSCASTCTSGQLRDNSTQRCVIKCPVNPSYWADPTTLNCVYTCPTTYFASSQNDRLCVTGCAIYHTFGDINARVCTNICPFNYYADNSTYLCVRVCPSTPDYYSDNTTLSCVLNCPKTSNWNTFADPTTRKCVTECPPGYFAKNSTQRCVTTCPTGSYADPIIRVCVAECTVRPEYYKQTDLTCVHECPASPKSYKYDGNHSCVYVDNTNGYTGCPSGYWANPLNNMCTTLCPAGYFADQTLHLCVLTCPSSYFSDPVDRLCKTSCSSAPEEYRLNLNIRTCQQFCPSPFFADNSTYDCVPQCTSSKYAYDITRKCVKNCPPPYYSHNLTWQCLLACPTPYFAQESTRSCQLTCISPYFADNSTNRCVLSCPDSPQLFGLDNVCRQNCPIDYYADNSTRQCVRNCPTQPVTFAQNSTRRCVIACPPTPNSFANNLTMQCVTLCTNNTFAEVRSRSCVQNCPSDLMTYADPITSACQPACPSPYFASDLTKECVPQCPVTPVKTYALTSSRTCVFTCPNGLFGQNITKTCASGCPQDLTAFADVTSNLCVSTCPFGWFADNATFKCVRNCPSSAFADNSTRKCLLKCPGTQRLYSDVSTLSCVQQCPTGSYGNNFNWTCINNCPPAVNGYKLDLSNLCVQQCPSPFFAYLPTRTCVINCGVGLFGDTATRICKSCDPNCPTCTSLTNCLSCINGLYLSFGVCMAVCPATTFANNNTRACVYSTGCPAGTFGNAQLKFCTAACPNKQYADKTTRLCTDCPDTCASCNSTSVCLTCVSYAAYSKVTTQCYAYCQPTLQYNFGGNCFSKCPDGSYLDYTNVYCQTCNAACKTCFGTATNCTSCDTTYFYNFTCVSKCPTNFYSANQSCLVCSKNVPACNKPLSFSTTTTTQNYQSVIIVKFTQAVKVSGDPASFISLNLKVNRRLQDYSKMVNNGLPYTATVLQDGTIKITLDPSVTLTNPSFTVSINDPSKITTSSGASLQSLTSAIENMTVNSYPAGTTSDAPLVIAGAILSVLMLIILAAVFLCSPVPIYLSLQAFQMIAFYAFITDLAPNFFYFLQKVSLTRLNFLPNILAGIYQTPPGFVSYLPTRATQIDGKLSFAGNAGSYLFVAFIYLIFGIFIKAVSTKSNSNRPLRELFDKLFQTRVKWSIVWDLLWIFGLNVMICGFLQFKYTVNGSDLAVAIISLLIFISLPAFGLFYRLKRYNPQDPVDVDNFRLIHQGLKQGKSQYMPYIFILRRLVFAAVVAGTAGGSSESQYTGLMTISCLMIVLLVVLRPYQQNLRNVVHIANEVGLTALGVGCIYYKHYVDILQPVGTKVINGTILTGGMIAHLSIALIWAVFRTYHFYKEIHKDFKTTQFYTLYLDQKYDQSLEKELQELNDESGEVQQVQFSNSTQLGDENQGEQTIKLKIKRRRKIKKGQAQEKKLPRRDEGEYIKISDKNESMLEIDNLKHQFKEEVFQPEIIVIKEQQKPIPNNIFIEDVEKSQGAWVEMDNRSVLVSQKQKSPRIQNLILSPKSQEQNIILPIDQLIIDDQPRKKEIVEISEISSVSHKEEAISKDEGENLRESISQIHEKQNQKRSEYQELASNQQDQLQNKSQMNDQNPHGEIPLNEYEQAKQQEQASDKAQDWREMSEWQQVHSNNEERKGKYQKNEGQLKEQGKMVIDLDQQANKQQKQLPQQNKKYEQWNVQIQDLVAENQKKEPNKKHMMLFELDDFE